jgi:hypothetical protein
VVPTKDRYDTLLVLIAYILDWQRDDVSVVVHDNSANNTPIHAFLKRHDTDSRLIYKHDPKPMSMVENFNGAMAKANGTYVCLLGDDDGLVEATVDFCHWMKSASIDSATFDRPRYDWPDLKKTTSSSVSDQKGTLTIPPCDGHLIEVDIYAELKRYLGAAVTNYKNLGPAPYNGLVARDIFNTTKDATGCYFPGTTPGMAAAISSFLTAKKHIHVGIPFICGGHSFNSAAGMGRRGQHIGEIEDVKSLGSETVKLWSPELPKFWSGFTINAESALQTLNAWRRSEIKDMFNFNRVVAACLIYLPNAYRLRSLLHIKDRTCTSDGIGFWGVLVEVSRIQYTRAMNLLTRRAQPANVSSHKTIAQALSYLQEYIVTEFPAVAPQSKLDIAQALQSETVDKSK